MLEGSLREKTPPGEIPRRRSLPRENLKIDTNSYTPAPNRPTRRGSDPK